MKIYHHLFPIKLWDNIKNFLLESTYNLNTESFYAIAYKFPKSLRDDFKKEILSYNLPPPFEDVLILKRKNFITCEKKYFHIDSHPNHYDESTKVSLIIPIIGYQNTAMHWANGDYKTTTERDKYGIKIKRIEWAEKFQIIETKEILEPTICRVDIPHHATSDSLGNYRVVGTIRFYSNPSIEEVISKRFNSNVA